MNLKQNTEKFRLTYPQENIWLVEKFNKGLPINSIVGTIEINEKFDAKICNEAINHVIKNNDAMRIAVYSDEVKVYQQVKEYKEEIFEVINLSLKNEFEIQKYINDCVLLPLFFDENKLYEFKIFQYNENSGAIFMKIHHIISDAWSCSKIGTQLIEYIEKKQNHEEIVETEQPSYIDFIKNEITYENSEKFLKDEHFWREYLENIPKPISLKSSETRRTTAAKRLSVKLDEKLNEKINAYCKENKISVYALFLSAISIYMHKINQIDDFVIGVPVLNRSNFKEKNMLGMFVSTNPLRIKLKKELTFLELAKQISLENLKVFKHQKYPYAKTLEYIHSHTDIKNNLYNLVVSYQNARANLLDSKKYSTTWKFNENLNDELQIHITDMDNTGVLNMNYDYLTDLFSKNEILYLHKRLMFILQTVIEGKSEKIEELEIMDAVEKEKIFSINHTHCEYPKDKTVIDLLIENVKKYPNRILAQQKEKNITYQEFYQRICNFSSKLSDIKKENVIVCLDNSIEMLVAIYGILMSGNTYIPINPNTPIARIAQIAQNSNCQFAVMKNQVLDHITYLSIDYDETLPMNDISYAKVEDTAYMIYTSGSTGTPKGVMISHQSLTNYIWWAKKSYAKEEIVCMPLYSSIAFDLTVTTLFLPIVAGGKIVIYDYSSTEILKIFEEDKVNLVKLTPAHLALINESDITFENIHTLIVGGEALKTQDAKNITKKGKNLIIYNEYGPTEATVGCMIYQFLGMEKESTLPIGKPADNTQIYILDKNKKLCPIGMVGEIYIQGDSLSLGYHNLEEKNKEAFLCSPFNNRRMYKSNDLAKLDFDGNIKYLGRADKQIKINGNRIELEEIENLAKNLFKLKNVIVDVKKISNIQNLCMYYVHDEQLDEKYLKMYLSKFLPQYMIPTKYIKIEKIPMTINGKVDRSKLKIPSISKNLNHIEEQNGTRAVKQIYYESSFEEQVCHVWEEILNMEKVSPLDNIFDYGVDSLNIIRCQVKLSNYTNLIDVQKFYEYPVIRDFCENINSISRVEKNKMLTEELLKQYKVVDVKRKFDSRKKIKNVLLLGATGFLGQHVLKDFITNDTIEHVYCIVRGEDFETRLYNRFQFYFADSYQEEYKKKVIVINANIQYENLDLSDEELDEVMKHIDRVINCAAMVKHYGNYLEFESINVDSVKNIVDICLKYHLVLEHISTVSISSDGIGEIFDETKFYINQNYQINPYIQTKFEAELYIFEMMKKKGLLANIYRIGNLTWRYCDGKYQRNVFDNGFFMRIKNILDLGKYPVLFDKMKIEMSPVDIVATCITKLVLDYNETVNEIYHLYNPNTINFSDMMKIIIQNNKLRLEEMPNDEFMDLLKSYDSRENVLLNDIITSMGTIDVKMDNHYTLQRLEKLGVTLPKLEENYIRNLLKYLNKS